MSIGDRLRELELRIESLDVAVREIHPDYVPGIIARTTELENLCREHVNSTCRVLENQRRGVETVVKEAEARAESAVASLMKAANRHHEEAHNLRAELVPFKEMVDKQSQESESNLAKMKDLFEHSIELLDRQTAASTQLEGQLSQLCRLEALSFQVHASLQDLRSSVHRHREPAALVHGSVPRASSMPVVDFMIRYAQRLAEVRSPSSRAVSLHQRRIVEERREDRREERSTARGSRGRVHSRGGC